MDLLRTSNYDLENLLNQLNIKDFAVISREQLENKLNDPNIKSIICNLSNNTHWIAIYKPKKIYFDSFGQVPIPEVSGYSFNTKTIQDIQDQDCGQLCVLFLYYANHDKVRNFFRLFKTRYDY